MKAFKVPQISRLTVTGMTVTPPAPAAPRRSASRRSELPAPPTASGRGPRRRAGSAAWSVDAEIAARLRSLGFPARLPHQGRGIGGRALVAGEVQFGGRTEIVKGCAIIGPGGVFLPSHVPRCSVFVGPTPIPPITETQGRRL
jgi:hypothetical protein